jgi:hypothetical protein
LQTEEAGNIAIAEEFDSDLIYTGPERAMLATTSLTWVLNLGATKHFTSD